MGTLPASPALLWRVSLHRASVNRTLYDCSSLVFTDTRACRTPSRLRIGGCRYRLPDYYCVSAAGIQNSALLRCLIIERARGRFGILRSGHGKEDLCGFFFEQKMRRLEGRKIMEWKIALACIERNMDG
ncbi:unnamed protein product [Diplocarpon coronariae]